MSIDNLSVLKPNTGANKKNKRLGRGIGSGWGKTAGKGHKGQKARKGSGPAVGFEGGQTPLHKRLPKYGFSRKHKKIKYNLLGFDSLEKFEDGAVVNKEALLNLGIIKKLNERVKILANKTNISFPKKLKIELDLLDKVSNTAQKVLTSAGGSFKGANCD